MTKTEATERPSRSRPSLSSRRIGYLVAVLLNAAFLYAVNSWPGWQALPILTGETPEVLGLVNASLIISLVANAVYLLYDPRWLRALGDLSTTAVGLVAMVRIWQVFPFDFGERTFDWELLVRIVLVVGIVGSGIGIVVAVVSLVRALAGGSDRG